jgi:opacity protein-like surface antigen
MKLKRLGMFLVCAVATSAFAADVTMAGKWTVSVSVSGNEGTADCTFVQTGSDLSGSCVGQDGEHKLTGKVDGNKLTFQYEIDYNGTPLTLGYSATVTDPDQITGVVSVQPVNVDGDFTAKRARQAPAPTSTPTPDATPSAH